MEKSNGYCPNAHATKKCSICTTRSHRYYERSTNSKCSDVKTNAIETATENERGVVDIETLKQTQSDIIDTIEQTLQIQHDGRQKRQAAEKELSGLENDLKQHLLSMKRIAQSMINKEASKMSFKMTHFTGYFSMIYSF